MKEPGERDIENLLRSVAPTPAPPGLRERILNAAATDKAGPVLSRFVRIGLAACAAIMIVVGLTDRALWHAEDVRLATLVGPAPLVDSDADEWAAIDEVFAGMPLAMKKLRARPDMRFRPGARSWDALKEDFDGGQNAENHN